MTKDIFNLKLINEEEVNIFSNKHMAHNRSFKYIKGSIGGYKDQINIAKVCVETGEFILLKWGKEDVDKD